MSSLSAMQISLRNKEHSPVSPSRISAESFHVVDAPPTPPVFPCESSSCEDSSDDGHFSSRPTAATFTRNRIHRSRSYITEVSPPAENSNRRKTQRRGSLTFAASVNDFPRAGASRSVQGDSPPRRPRRASMIL